VRSREGGDTVDSAEESVAAAGSAISTPCGGAEAPPEIAGGLAAKVGLVGVPGLRGFTSEVL
jgi:hypothetical protein